LGRGFAARGEKRLIAELVMLRMARTHALAILIMESALRKIYIDN